MGRYSRPWLDAISGTETAHEKCGDIHRTIHEGTLTDEQWQDGAAAIIHFEAHGGMARMVGERRRELHVKLALERHTVLHVDKKSVASRAYMGWRTKQHESVNESYGNRIRVVSRKKYPLEQKVG